MILYLSGIIKKLHHSYWAPKKDHHKNIQQIMDDYEGEVKTFDRVVFRGKVYVPGWEK